MLKKFSDLDAFKHATDLVTAIYSATKRFPDSELYGLVSQLRRAAVSVASDIAEGQGRLSLGEWRQMLSHARGSLFEIQAQLLIAERLRFISAVQHANLMEAVARVGRPLWGLIQYVRRREAESRRRLTNRQPATLNSTK